MSLQSNVSSEFRLIPLTQLIESPHNPRRRFTEATLDELAASIRIHGVITPLLARPEGDLFEIAAGHRRYRAAYRAKLAKVPVIIREMTDQQFMEVLTVENLQREDVHPFEEAQGYRELMRLPGYDVTAVAAKIGRSETYVRARLRLLDMADDVAEAFLADRITFAHARLIAPLPANRQSEALGACFDQYGKQHLAPASDLREWIHDGDGETLSDAPFPLDDAELLPAAGACLTCPKSTCGEGKLFADDDGEETCFDKKCFEAKIEAKIERHKSAGLVEISTAWDAKKKSDPEALHRDEYTRVEAPEPKAATAPPVEDDEEDEEDPAEQECEFLEAAIITSGHDRGKTTRICRNEECPVHGKAQQPAAARGSNTVDHGMRAQQLERQNKQREEWERRRGVNQRLAAVWSPALDGDLAFFLLLDALNRTHSAADLQGLIKRFGLGKPAAEDTRDALKAVIYVWAERADSARLRDAVIYLLFLDEVERQEWHTDYDLLAIAEDRLAEQLEPKKAAKAAKTGKKAKA